MFSSSIMFSFASIFSRNANDDGRGYVFQYRLIITNSIKVLTYFIVATTKTPTQQTPLPYRPMDYISSLISSELALDLFLDSLTSCFCLSGCIRDFLLLQIFFLSRH